MTAASRERFAAVVRAEEVDLGLACVLLGAEVEPNLDVPGALGELDRLASVCAPYLGVLTDPAEQATALHLALGRDLGFAGSAADYGDLRASLLHEVLRRRHGLPILLSVVWLEVARRLHVPAYGVGLPGHFVVGVGDPEGATLLADPFSGGTPLDPPAVSALVASTGAALAPEHLRAWTPGEILLRVLTNVRVWAARPDRLRHQLWATELALLLPRHPAALRRERGELLVRMGDFLGGAAELETYAAAIAPLDPATAQELHRQARSARARLN